MKSLSFSALILRFQTFVATLRPGAISHEGFDGFDQLHSCQLESGQIVQNNQQPSPRDAIFDLEMLKNNAFAAVHPTGQRSPRAPIARLMKSCGGGKVWLRWPVAISTRCRYQDKEPTRRTVRRLVRQSSSHQSSRFRGMLSRNRFCHPDFHHHRSGGPASALNADLSENYDRVRF